MRLARTTSMRLVVALALALVHLFSFQVVTAMPAPSASTTMAELVAVSSLGQCICENYVQYVPCPCDVVKITPPEVRIDLFVDGEAAPSGVTVLAGSEISWEIYFLDYDIPCVCHGNSDPCEDEICVLRQLVWNTTTGEVLTASASASSVTPTECGDYEIIVQVDTCICDSGGDVAEFSVIGDAELGACYQSGECVPEIVFEATDDDPPPLVACLPPDNVSAIQVGLGVLPEEELAWSLVGETHGATINALTGLLVAGHEEGWITIRVCYGGENPPLCCYDPEDPEEFQCCEEFSILLRNCDEDGDCESCDSGDCVAGGGTVSVGSVNVFLDLGKTPEGKSAGYLAIHELTLTGNLATPQVLKLVRGEGTTFVREANPIYPGQIIQVRSPEVVADIIVGGTGYDWKIEFYPDSQLLESFTPGVGYNHTGSPINTWEFDYIASPESFTITKRTPGLADVTYVYGNGEGTGEQDMRLMVTEVNGPVLRDEEIRWFGDDVRQFVYRDIMGNETLSALEELSSSGGTQRIMSRTIDPGGLALRTDFEYYLDSAPDGKKGRLKSVRHPDGSWEWYDYDAYSRQTLVVRPWLDSTLPGSGDPNPSQHRATVYDYEGLDTNDTLESRKPRTITESILGKLVSKTYRAYLNEGGTTPTRIEIEERCTSASASFGDSSSLRTEVTFLDLSDDKIDSIVFPDGRIDDYQRETVYCDMNYVYPNVPTFTSFPESPSDEECERITITHKDSAPTVVDFKSTQDVVVEDSFGRVLLEQSYVANPSALLEYTVRKYDDQGHQEESWRSDDTDTTSDWGCCFKFSDTDATGIITEYEYDGLGRLTKEKKLGVSELSFGQEELYPLQKTIETSYTLDTLGRVKATLVQPENDTISAQTARSFDSAGRVDAETDQAGLVTYYSYATLPGGGRQVTVTLPGGLTRVTDYHRDGQIVKVTGTAQVNQFYTYGVNTNNTSWTKQNQGAASGGPYTTTTSDLLGRRIRLDSPGRGTSDVIYTYFVYNIVGQLQRQWSNVLLNGRSGITLEPGAADTLYEYDTLGELTRTCIDIDRDGAVDLAGPDQLTDTDSSYVQLNGEWWLETTTSIYPDESSSNSVVVGKQRRRLTGFDVSNPANPAFHGAFAIAFSESEDIHGNVTSSETAVDTNIGMVQESLFSPESNLPQLTVSRNGVV